MLALGREQLLSGRGLTASCSTICQDRLAFDRLPNFVLSVFLSRAAQLPGVNYVGMSRQLRWRVPPS